MLHAFRLWGCLALYSLTAPLFAARYTIDLSDGDFTVSFGPRGEWACRVVQNEKQAIAVSEMNDLGKLYDDIIPTADGESVFFDAPNRYHYFARAGNAFLRVDEWITADIESAP